VCSPFDPIPGALRAFRGKDKAVKARLYPEPFRFSGKRWAFVAHGNYLKGRKGGWACRVPRWAQRSARAMMPPAIGASIASTVPNIHLRALISVRSPSIWPLSPSIWPAISWRKLSKRSRTS